MKKLIRSIPLLLIFFLFLITTILIRDINRHGTISNAIDSWFYVPLFDLTNENKCYELRPGSINPIIIVMKDFDVKVENINTFAPTDGSVMVVSKTNFNSSKYYYECHKFRGYFTLKSGVAQWYLTEVIE